MKETKFKQVMKSLDTYRTGKTGKVVLTEEQKEFLIACRDNPVPVSWEKIAELWQQIGWGQISNTSARLRYKLAKAK